MHKTMVLCAARHEMPENDGAIFGTEVDPLDIITLDRIADAIIRRK